MSTSSQVPTRSSPAWLTTPLKVDLGYGNVFGWQPDAPAELPLWYLAGQLTIEATEHRPAT